MRHTVLAKIKGVALFGMAVAFVSCLLTQLHVNAANTFTADNALVTK